VAVERLKTEKKQEMPNILAVNVKKEPCKRLVKPDPERFLEIYGLM
jgi:hypothetical protein